MTPTVDIFFDESQPFTLAGNTAKRVAWFEGQHRCVAAGDRRGKLDGTVAIVDADLGRGKLFAIGPEVAQRTQPHATFKLLFNGLLCGLAVAATDALTG